MSAEEVLQRALSEIFRQKNRHYFHFCEMGHHAKIAALRHFVTAPRIGCLLARDTTEAHSLPPEFSPSVALYQQMVGYLLEVVSRRGGYVQEEVTIYIEARCINHATLPGFLAYVQQAVNRGALTIDSQWISTDRIHVIEKKQHLLCDIADGLAHAGRSALEPDAVSGEREERYYSVIVEKLWGREPHHRVSVYDHGLLLRPKRRQAQFVQEYGCLDLSYPRSLEK